MSIFLKILNVHNLLHIRVYDFTLGWSSGSWGCAGAVSNRLMATVKVGVGVPQAAMLVTHWVSQVLAPADDLNARAPFFFASLKTPAPAPTPKAC